jgi:hypothetical protein
MTNSTSFWPETLRIASSVLDIGSCRTAQNREEGRGGMDYSTDDRNQIVIDGALWLGDVKLAECFLRTDDMRGC